MTDRFETPPQVLAEGSPPTKSTRVRRYEHLGDECDALPQTKTQTPRGSTEAFAVQKLPTHFGRYRLIRELGRGGMGAVVLAEDTQLARLVALKIPFLKKSSDTRTLKRFQREAKAAASLSHPNLCPVYDFGTIGKHHFLSMAYIEGKPLQAFLDSKTSIPQRTAAGLIKKVAQALQHAHERGVIHRDLKPSNIMIEPKLGPIVTDFGLARCLDDESDSPLTQDGVAIGTPSYMSPEQLDGDSAQIGPQSDIFSLGLILYEILIGERRFQGKVTRIIGQILTKDPTPLRAIREDVDPDLDLICQKMMARNPAERYGSMAEVAETMRAYLKGELRAPHRQNAFEEITSDPEGFFLGLAANEGPSSPAPSTSSGAALIRTREEIVPPLVISEEDSRSSRILQRANAKRSPLTSLIVTAGLLAVALGWGLHRIVPSGNATDAVPSLPLATVAAAESSELLPEEELSEPAGERVEPSSPSAVPEEKLATETKWKVEETPPEIVTPVLPVPTTPAPMPMPPMPTVEPQTSKPPLAETTTLKPVAGKLNFRAIIHKTINGKLTKKKILHPSFRALGIGAPGTPAKGP